MNNSTKPKLSNQQRQAAYRAKQVAEGKKQVSFFADKEALQSKPPLSELAVFWHDTEPNLHVAAQSLARHVRTMYETDSYVREEKAFMLKVNSLVQLVVALSKLLHDPEIAAIVKPAQE